MQKKASFKRLFKSYEMIQIFTVTLFVNRDSKSLILKKNNSISVFYLLFPEAY